MARGRPIVIIQAAFVLAYLVAGSHAAFGQVPQGGLSLPGINLGLVKVAPTTLNLGSGGVSVVAPGISVGGVLTVSPTSVSASTSGVSATVGGANVAGGLANVTPTSGTASKSGVSAAVGGVSVTGVASVSTTSVNVSQNGISATGLGANVANLVVVSPTSVNVSQKGIAVTGPSANVANLVVVSPASVNLSPNNVSVVLPGATVAGGLISVAPISASVSKNGVSVDLPAVSLPGATIELGGLNTSGNGPVVEPPAITPTPPAQTSSKTISGTEAQSVLDQASPVAKLVASIASAEAMAPVDQLIGGLTFGEAAPANCVDVSSLALAPELDLGSSSWNAMSIASREHEGYQVRGDAPACGSTLPFQTLQRTYLPGSVWDASKALGLKPGTLHFGFSGGTSESDTRVKATDVVRDAGFASSGTTKLKSWSMGGYSLFTTEHWYAGTALGGAWGQAETQNFVTGSESEYDTSGFVLASFVGTVVPIGEMVRFDLRGTLSYQRTVGDAHVDTQGIAYGDHTIESADASISGRLFGVFRDGETTLRPFLQAGVTHHLRYDNKLEIDGQAFQMLEADTSIFTAAGLDFEINRALQLSIGVRHDYSPDQETVTGRIGFSARLN